MKNVLFWDFDGTLVFCHHLWSNSVLTVLRENGIEAELKDVRPHMASGYPWDIPYPHTEIKNEAWWPFLYQKFSAVYQSFGIPQNLADRLGPRTRHLILDISKYHLYHDTRVVLEKTLEFGWQNILLSNNYPELRDTVRNLKLDQYFSDFVISGEIGLDKPQPEIFEYALTLAGQPERCYMIGDNPHADIEGAVNVGIPAFLVHRNTLSKALNRFDTLTDLLGVLSL